ncbi:MAG: glutamine amidotransferase [Mycobacteriaceae bacterium]
MSEGPSTLRIGLLLPDVMGTYGDGGNALVLRGRARLRGLDAEIVPITLDTDVPASCDVYTLGGGEDVAQTLATRHLARHRGLHAAVDRSVPVLAVCAGLQVLGHTYTGSDGTTVEGLGLLDVTTTPRLTRAIGELLVEPTAEGLTERLTGFENHRGATTLGTDARPLGRVLHGVGNGTGDGREGMVHGSIIATYLHGPVLARNPQLADLLLSRAMGLTDPSQLSPLNLESVALLRRERLAHKPSHAPRRRWWSRLNRQA